MTDSFYRALEDRYRGSRELIKDRLQVYLPFIRPYLGGQKADSAPRALDLGCGRGEWLEILTEKGFRVQGVDLDEGMLEVCWKNKLQAEKADALGYLGEQKNESFSVISAFHFVEHIPFVELQDLVGQALRVLKPGGLLILETPNPENIMVSTVNFYIDPSHQRPLPQHLLSFIAEYAGYARVKVLRLQEPEGLLESDSLSLLDVLSGVSLDYSVVAQKKAPKRVMKKFDAVFLKDYGISLDQIAARYEHQLTGKADDLKKENSRLIDKFSELSQAIAKVDKKTDKISELSQAIATLDNKVEKFSELSQAISKLDDKAELLRKERDELWAQNVAQLEQIQAIYSSRSWKLTAPIRWIKLFMVGGIHAVTGSIRWVITGVRRILLGGIRLILNKALQIGWVRNIGNRILRPFPRFKKWLGRLAGVGISHYFSYGKPEAQDPEESTIEQTLPKTARSIYAELRRRCIKK